MRGITGESVSRNWEDMKRRRSVSIMHNSSYGEARRKRTDNKPGVH